MLVNGVVTCVIQSNYEEQQYTYQFSVRIGQRYIYIHKTKFDVHSISKWYIFILQDVTWFVCPWYQEDKDIIIICKHTGSGVGSLVVIAHTYHTGDKGRFRSGWLGQKTVSEIIFISHLSFPMQITGIYQMEQVGTCESYVYFIKCFLWLGTIKNWWKPSPRQTDQYHTKWQFHQCYNNKCIVQERICNV